MAYTRALMLQQYSISLTVSAGATILALVVAKVILVVDSVPVRGSIQGQSRHLQRALADLSLQSGRLVYRIPGGVHPQRLGRSRIVAANRAVFEEFAWQKFAAVHIWLTLGIFMYCAATEIADSLGKKRFHELLFEPRQLAASVPNQATEKPPE